MFDKTYQFLNDIRAKEKQVCSVRLLCVHMEGGTDCLSGGGGSGKHTEGRWLAVSGKHTEAVVTLLRSLCFSYFLS